MKRLISDNRLYKAFKLARLGSEDFYDSWTALWALRSQIWSSKDMQKDAQKSLGELTKSAIENGTPEVFRHLAAALDEILIFERRTENAFRADIFFAIEELNRSREQFTRADLFAWLNKELETPLTEDDLDRELKLMKLGDLLPV